MKKILKNLLIYPGSSRRASGAPQDDGPLESFISHQYAGRRDDKGELSSLRLSRLEKIRFAQQTRSSQNPNGFILLEVVIALFIMGLTFQGGLLFMTHMNQQKKRMETETKQDMLLRTLAAHALIHGRLPWAAHKEASPETFGYEDKTHACQQGIVPFKTLGIAEHYAKDGYGHYFTYLVAKTRPTALTVSPMENYCRAQAEAPLVHRDYPMAPHDDFIVAALIHHGSKEHPQEAYPLPHLPESTPDRRVLWVTRNTLLTLYGQTSCAPFHQPLPERPLDGPPGIPRGYGR